MSVVYCWEKTSNENLEQQINIKFCVKIGKSATEMLAPLTLAYGEYAMKHYVLLNGTGSSRKVEMCKKTQEMDSQERKGQMQMWTENKPL
jgi:hypothetical protein